MKVAGYGATSIHEAVPLAPAFSSSPISLPLYTVYGTCRRALLREWSLGACILCEPTTTFADTEQAQKRFCKCARTCRVAPAYDCESQPDGTNADGKSIP